MSTTPHIPLPDQFVRELASLLGSLISAHEEYLGLLAEHREAVRRASPAAAAEVTTRQTGCLERIAMFEHARRALVQRVIDAGHWPGRELVTLTGLAERCGPMKQRLIDSASHLKTLIAKVRQEQGIVRRVSQSLASHIEGLMRTVAKAASHTGTYGRRGVVGTSSVVTALDVRS
ncbi:MAG: flagellar protein FlgN [Tepidisphaera sp.]